MLTSAHICQGSFLCARLTAEVIQTQGVSFQQGVQLLRSILPSTAVLVGQNIGQDVQWLQLKEGKDFQVITMFVRVLLINA